MASMHLEQETSHRMFCSKFSLDSGTDLYSRPGMRTWKEGPSDMVTSYETPGDWRGHI